jgi:amino acid adenylation domain-containing protein
MLIAEFEKQVEKFAQKIAIETALRRLTYEELDNHSTQVAHQLLKNRDLFVKGSEQPRAGLLFGHGADMIVGVLGASKADHIYVPLDITYPVNRLTYMLEDSGSRVILTNSGNLALAETLAARIKHNPEIINIDTDTNNNSLRDGSHDRIRRTPSGDKPLYILYTSGSTGKPKGVLQTHGNILYFTRNWTSRFSISHSDRITLFSAFSHDGSIPDIFGALHNGAALYPRNIKEEVSTSALPGWLIEKKITIWHSVPTLFRYFVNTLNNQGNNNNDFPDLRFIVLGGEKVIEYDVNMFQRFFPHSILANIYGQTESTVNSFWLVRPEDSFDRVLIGEPIDETKLSIIDENDGIIEDFGVGEIFIASEHLALGYWNDERNTRDAFLYDQDLGRLYRTGDMARLIPGGDIEILGRKDNQVKIRGFRVELGEIETALLKHADVKEAVVIAKEINPPGRDGVDADTTGGEKYDICLCACIVPGKTPDISRLREHLSQELPGYMIPTRFVQLDKMPLTPSNKIDRKALQELKELDIHLESTYVEPQNDVEETITGIWKKVLHLDKVGVNDNFFEVGGNSLNLIEVEGQLKHVFEKIDIPFGSIFTYPTIRSFAQYIGQQNMDENFSGVERDWFDQVKEGRNKLKTKRRIAVNQNE